MRALHLRYALLGTAMGLGLGRIGFSSFDEVHAMFTFVDLRLLYTFAFGVALSALGIALLAKRRDLPRRPLHPGTIPGGISFGLGWAITGACPAVVMIQLGEGKLLALYTFAGILLGNWVYGKVHRRFFRWDAGTCGA